MTSQAVMKRYINALAKKNQSNAELQKLSTAILNFKKLTKEQQSKVNRAVETAYEKLQAKGVSAKKVVSKPTSTPKAKSSSTGNLKAIISDLKNQLGTTSFKAATTNTNIAKDIKLAAYKKGKRIVRNAGKTTNEYGTFENKVGSTYYENRANRYDANQPSATRKYKLAKGGSIDEIKVGDKFNTSNGSTFYIDQINKQDSNYPYFVIKSKASDLGEVISQDEFNRYLKNGFFEKVDGKFAKGGVPDHKVILSFQYNPGNLSNEEAERIVSKYTKDWKHDNDLDDVSFYVFGLTRAEAVELRRELKMEDTYNIEMDNSQYAKGGKVADMYVAVGEKDGYWTIISRPSSKENSQKLLDLPNSLPRGEVGKVVSVEDAKNHKLVVGREYLKFAKGGEVKSPLKIEKRLEAIRKSIRNENVSYGELVELQDLSQYIDSNDIELREAAGIPEFEDDDEFAKGGDVKTPIKIKKRLEAIRKSIQNENVSYGELVELQDLSQYIDSNDIELREAAGIPEFEDDDEFAKGGEVSSKYYAYTKIGAYPIESVSFWKNRQNKQEPSRANIKDFLESVPNDERVCIYVSDVSAINGNLHSDKIPAYAMGAEEVTRIVDPQLNLVWSKYSPKSVYLSSYAKGGTTKTKFKVGDKVVGQFRDEYGQGLVPVSIYDYADRVKGVISNVRKIDTTTMYSIKFDNGEELQYPDFAIDNFIVKSQYAKGGIIEHGLKTGDRIVSGKTIGTTIIVRNESWDEDAKIDLNTGVRTPITYDKKLKKWVEKMADGGKIESLKVGSKLGFLRPETGRYAYAEVLSIDGNNVKLVVRHPKKTYLDNYFTETKERILEFLNTPSEDWKDGRPVVKIKYENGGTTKRIKRRSC